MTDFDEYHEIGLSIQSQWRSDVLPEEQGQEIHDLKVSSRIISVLRPIKEAFFRGSFVYKVFLNFF